MCPECETARFDGVPPEIYDISDDLVGLVSGELCQTADECRLAELIRLDCTANMSQEAYEVVFNEIIFHVGIGVRWS